MRRRIECLCFLLSSSSTFTKVAANQFQQAVTLYEYTFDGEGRTARLLIVELEKIDCTEFQEDDLRGQTSLFRVSVMEKCIVQWKVASRVMVSHTACNGKTHSVQWKVDLYIQHKATNKHLPFPLSRVSEARFGHRKRLSLCESPCINNFCDNERGVASRYSLKNFAGNPTQSRL